jgi:predicted homoserine dehydrogenase-like protein
MIYRQLFDRLAGGKMVRAGLIGAGHFATAIVTQSVAIRRMDLPVVAEVDVDLARKAFRLAGYAEEDIALCSSRSQALAALERGQRVVLPDAMLMMDLPIDVVIECTGVPEAAARYCEAAIRQGKHVANVTKEMDVVIGPILKHLADQAGVVYSTVDGDQPGLLIGLVEWARELGLEVLSGGKSIDGEFTYDAEAKRLVFNGHPVALDTAGAHLFDPIEPGRAERVLAGRTALLPSPLTEDDMAELGIVANATGLMPEAGGPYAPPLRTPEIPEVLCPIEEGGILHQRGVIDAVVTLHGPHEAGMGGGVFVVVGCENDYSRYILTMKGLIANQRRTTMLIYRPFHLCGVEAPMTALCAALLKIPTGATDPQPRVDVVARAVRNIAAGEPAGYELGDVGEEESMREYLARVQPAMHTAGPVRGTQPLPLFMGSGARLKVDVPEGTTITADMVDRPADSRLWALRAEQDKLFFENTK